MISHFNDGGRVAVVVSVVVLAVALVTTAFGAGFADPTGDVAVAPRDAMLTGLDISGVEVTNTSGVWELVTFRVTLAGAPALPPYSAVTLMLNVDKKGTGSGGTDALVALEVTSTGAQAFRVARHDPATQRFVFYRSNGSAAYTNGIVDLSIPRLELDNTRGFTFVARTVTADSDEITAAAVDVAPDTESWTYHLIGLPPLLQVSRAYGEPTRPRTGERFSVISEVTREDSGELVRRGNVTCEVRVGEAPIRAIGRLSGVGARCAMIVPRNTHGRILHGSIQISAAGETAKRRFVFRIT